MNIRDRPALSTSGVESTADGDFGTGWPVVALAAHDVAWRPGPGREAGPIAC